MKGEASLFVGNISRQVSQRELEKLFLRYGECKLNLKVLSACSQADYPATIRLHNLRKGIFRCEGKG